MNAVIDETHSGIVFIYSALRSGSTLFRLMLDASPEISNPGEMDFLFDHLHRTHSGVWEYDRQSLTQDRVFRSASLELDNALNGRALLDSMLSQIHRRHRGRMTLTVHRNAQKIVALFPAARFIHLLRDPRDVARSSIGMGWAGTL